jgi:hypothetical protein
VKLKKLVARVMRALPNLAPGVVGEQDIIDILNQAQEHLSRLSVKTVSSEHEIEAEYNIVPFPTDLLTLDSVYWTSSAVERELYPARNNMPLGNEANLEDEVDETTEPTRYYTKGSRIEIYPRPYVDGTVTMTYVARPTEMSDDDDTPDLEGSDNYLIAFALHRLHLEASSPLFQIWESEKNKEEYTFMQTTDQNYRTGFTVQAQW